MPCFFAHAAAISSWCGVSVMVWFLILMCRFFGWYGLGSSMPWWLRCCMVCLSRCGWWFVLVLGFVVGLGYECCCFLHVPMALGVYLLV